MWLGMKTEAVAEKELALLHPSTGGRRGDAMNCCFITTLSVKLDRVRLCFADIHDHDSMSGAAASCSHFFMKLVSAAPASFLPAAVVRSALPLNTKTETAVTMHLIMASMMSKELLR